MCLCKCTYIHDDIHDVWCKVSAYRLWCLSIIHRGSDGWLDGWLDGACLADWLADWWLVLFVCLLLSFRFFGATSVVRARVIVLWECPSLHCCLLLRRCCLAWCGVAFVPQTSSSRYERHSFVGEPPLVVGHDGDGDGDSDNDDGGGGSGDGGGREYGDPAEELMRAAKADDLPGILSALSFGADVNYVDHVGRTPLIAAAACGHECATALLCVVVVVVVVLALHAGCYPASPAASTDACVVGSKTHSVRLSVNIRHSLRAGNAHAGITTALD